ncbi:1,4-dihydroxy-6-naphthoate synthase [Streptomyces cavernae]|uniref:1,4-dihydroxy-6-naphthoate synthase n=1 Tax=Streptomyces cavernae TaxID=2259034 RepID=UPI000FEBB376|nr:1,4-dihydroxy-6-naphthoate synthase [Streptomyces cavernae]
MTPRLTLAHSPCPNDTFVFHALTHGLVPGAPEADVRLADIDITNGLAERSELDVLKVSYAVLPHVLDHYALLPCGGAVGRGCGPLVLVKDGDTADTLAGARVAVPSTSSTAYLLFRLWAARTLPGGVGEIVVLPFHEIMPAVRDGLVDAGLVIHEARFTYGHYGLRLVTDLGEEWEKQTGLPVPLGAIIARRSLGARRLGELARAIRASVQSAWNAPEASRAYVLKHAQEMATDVVDQHIELYVNSFTAELGDDGQAAVRALLGRSAELGLLPAVPDGALDFPAVPDGAPDPPADSRQRPQH